MAISTINNLEPLSSVRVSLNSNFSELFSLITSLSTQLESLSTQVVGVSGGGGGEVSIAADLTVKDQNDANAVTYTGQTSVTVGGEFSAASSTCDPVKLYDGSAVTSLIFDGNFFGGPSTFSLYTNNAMSSLTNLSFAYTGTSDFDLSDTSGFDNVTDISFSFCGYNTSFSWTDMSGMDSLTNVSMTYCGYFGFMVINDTVNQIPESAALAILNAILNDPFAVIPSAGNCTIDLYTTGTSTLQSAIANLEGNGWIINITT